MNTAKTFILMGLLTGLLVLIGDVIRGPSGMAFALCFAGVMNFASYWFSDKIVLAMYGAKPISEGDAPELYGLVERLTHQADLPMPKLYLLETDMPNAFATGRNPHHSAVAVTSGLMRILNTAEVEGVLAHELAHVKNRDILIGSIAATMAGALMLLARMAGFAAMFGGGGRSSDDDRGGAFGALFLMILGAVGAFLIQMAISRSREYEADRTGAAISGKPLGLANALLKLERGNERVAIQAEPATAHMFIVNPLKGGGIGSLFSTHPPITQRVARLERMANDSDTSRD